MTVDTLKTSKSPIKPKRKHGWRKFGIIVGLMGLYVLGEYTIPRFPFGPYTLYGNLTAEQRQAVIPYESLTDEQSYPFQSRLSRRPYDEAISRFPSVRDCLVESEAGKQIPDIRLIDWRKLRNHADAEVCFWRFSSSLRAYNKTIEWAKFHGAYLSDTPWQEPIKVGGIAFRRGVSFPVATGELYTNLTVRELTGVIAYEVLADEQSFPFMGKYPAPGHKLRDHDTAISKFPSVRDCLVRSEFKNETPDLRLINWDKIHNMSDADVCTWRIFSSFGTPERAVDWLEFHGARNARITNLSTRVSGNWPMSHNIKVNGKWQKERRALIFPTRGWHFLRKERFRRGSGLSSLWDEHGNLESVYWKWQVVL